MHWVIAHFSLITIRIYCILSAIIVFYFAEIYIAYRNAIFCNGTLDPDLKLGKRSNVNAAMQTNRMMPHECQFLNVSEMTRLATGYFFKPLFPSLDREETSERRLDLHTQLTPLFIYKMRKGGRACNSRSSRITSSFESSAVVILLGGLFEIE